jgi:hypothetical protein
VEEEEE